jgi:hypothetical protein
LEGGDFEGEFIGLYFESGNLGEMGFLFGVELGFVFFLSSEFEVDVLDGLIEEFGGFVFVGELIEVFGFEVFDLLGEGLFEFLLLFEVVFEVGVLTGEGFDGGFGDLMFFFECGLVGSEVLELGLELLDGFVVFEELLFLAGLLCFEGFEGLAGR